MSVADTSTKPVTTLLSVTLTACEEMTEMVQAIYGQLGKTPGSSMLKEDKSFFSLADGVVQALLIRLLSKTVGAIVGEEDEASIRIDGDGPFRAAEIEAPAELEPVIIRLRTRMDELAGQLTPLSELAQFTAFIDPIDGTKEFCTGLGEQCSICVGLADASGVVVGGLVYRPLCEQRSWALGCHGEGLRRSALRDREDLALRHGAGGGAGVFLCSNGGVSPFLKALQAELGYTSFPAGGAGNKALLVLELPEAVYIQDRGLSRWDSCAAQGVLEAHGGVFARLDTVVAEATDAPAAEPALVPYTYLEGGDNSVFVPELALLTKYNARPGVETGGLATSAAQLKPYANVVGLFAVPATADRTAIAAAVRRVAREVPPKFD